MYVIFYFMLSSLKGTKETIQQHNYISLQSMIDTEEVNYVQMIAQKRHYEIKNEK